MCKGKEMQEKIEDLTRAKDVLIEVVKKWRACDDAVYYATKNNYYRGQRDRAQEVLSFIEGLF